MPWHRLPGMLLVEVPAGNPISLLNSQPVQRRYVLDFQRSYKLGVGRLVRSSPDWWPLPRFHVTASCERAWSSHAVISGYMSAPGMGATGACARAACGACKRAVMRLRCGSSAQGGPRGAQVTTRIGPQIIAKACSARPRARIAKPARMAGCHGHHARRARLLVLVQLSCAQTLSAYIECMHSNSRGWV